MAEPVWRKTSEAFTEGSSAYEHGNDYLTALRSNWRDNENGITRASALIVGLAALFEFTISNNNAGDATLWGVKISHSDVVKFALPVIVAYLWYYVTYSFIESAIFQQAHDAVVSRLYPSIYAKDNERELHPANSLIGSGERVKFALGRGGWKSGFGSWTGRARPAFIALMPLAFLVIAYLQLYMKYRNTAHSFPTDMPVLLAASIIVSLILAFASAVNLAIFGSVLNERRAKHQSDDKDEANQPSDSPETQATPSTGQSCQSTEAGLPAVAGDA